MEPGGPDLHSGGQIQGVLPLWWWGAAAMSPADPRELRVLVGSPPQFTPIHPPIPTRLQTKSRCVFAFACAPPDPNAHSNLVPYFEPLIITCEGCGGGSRPHLVPGSPEGREAPDPRRVDLLIEALDPTSTER